MNEYYALGILCIAVVLCLVVTTKKDIVKIILKRTMSLDLCALQNSGWMLRRETQTLLHPSCTCPTDLRI
jgi:hypothetical protein